MVTFFLFVPSPPPVFMDIDKYPVVWVLSSLVIMNHLNSGPPAKPLKHQLFA